MPESPWQSLRQRSAAQRSGHASYLKPKRSTRRPCSLVSPRSNSLHQVSQNALVKRTLALSKSLLVIVLSALGRLGCCYGSDFLLLVGRVGFGRPEAEGQPLIAEAGGS